MGKEGTGSLFSQGGEENPLGGGGGARTAKSLRRPAPAMQICREQSAPDEGRAGGAREGCRDSAYGGAPPRLDPRTNPKCAHTGWEVGDPSSSRPCLWHFLLQCARGVGEPGSGRGGTHPSTFDFFPLQSTPVLGCVGTCSHTTFMSRTTPLSGFVGAAQGWAPQDSGHPGTPNP